MKKRLSLLVDTLRLPAFETREDAIAFWRQHDKRRLGFRTFFLVCGLIIISALAILDVFAGGEQASLLIGIRAVTVTLLAVTFYYFCQRNTPVMREVLISIFGIITVVSLSIMTLVGPMTVMETYPFIASATVIYGHCLLLPRFYTQAAFCLVVNLIYWPTVTHVEIAPHVFYTNAFVLSIATISALIGAWVRERLQREHAINQTNLSSAMEEALKANRAKSHLLANVSHELRTPLNAIIGFSEMMTNEVFGRIDQNVYRQYARDIHFSGKLLHTNIEDLLDLSRLEVGKMHWNEDRFSVLEALQKVISTCAAHDKSINVVLAPDFETYHLEVTADRDRISQVFINIITNAMKFSEPGSTINISSELELNGAVTLRFADQGVGISQADLERIREPFNQATRSSYVATNTGLGLGLAIVSGILERCDGTLDIESEIGVGTTISVQLPSERVSISNVHRKRKFGGEFAGRLAS